jgi:hypothetical protein
MTPVSLHGRRPHATNGWNLDSLPLFPNPFAGRHLIHESHLIAPRVDLNGAIAMDKPVKKAPDVSENDLPRAASYIPNLWLQEPLIILEMEARPRSRSDLVRLRDGPDCEPRSSPSSNGRRLPTSRAGSARSATTRSDIRLTDRGCRSSLHRRTPASRSAFRGAVSHSCREMNPIALGLASICAAKDGAGSPSKNSARTSGE